MSDPAPKLDVAKHRRRRIWLLASVAVLLTLVVLFGRRDSEGVLEGGAGAAVPWVIAFGLIIALIAIIMPLLSGERRRLVARVQAARPGATVIPGSASAETKVDAPRGASRRGMRFGGGPVVIAVLPQTIEVWSRGDTAPRWTIDRTRMRVAVGYQRNGNSTSLGLFVDDGTQAVRFLPADESVGMFNEVGRVESALRALGEDPDQHLNRS